MPPTAPESDPPQYRVVRQASDEGGAFLAERDALADFYVRVMGGRVRDDGPGIRLKWSRDWEYPWVLTRAGLAPGMRVLDCGAGNSPVPFVMASRGVSVVAIDRDAVVASRLGYAGLVARDWCRSLVGLPMRLPGSSSSHAAAMPSSSHAAAMPSASHAMPSAGPGPAPPSPPRRLPVRAWSFLRFNLVRRHRVAFSRIWKPDFWGPVSPALLARYRIDYTRGDLTCLPFPDASFDVVSCISVLEHMPPDTRTRGVREMARVLKPGGRLLLTYDLQERDLTSELLVASALDPVEFARLEDVEARGGRRRPDAIAMHLMKPAAGAAASGAARHA
ncbi:MAG: class I SAM-dependent methyltransferase [Acidobacteriota bacterium]